METASKNWVRLDNAAKIYPAASTRKWSACFRFSANLREDIEPQLLQKALLRLQPRFPVFFMHLRKGLFWYYLEQSDRCPLVEKDRPYPCSPLTPKRNGGFSFRVLYYGKRIAAEFFHVIADGFGGLCFFKTLVAEYLTLKYGLSIPRDQDILDCEQPPRAEEMEDSFLRYAGDVAVSRSESSAYHLSGDRESNGFIHITTGLLNAPAVLAKAKEYKTSVNNLLVAVMIQALLHLEKREGLSRRRQQPVKICVPINLRNTFPSRTLRNFSSFINPGVDPRLGEYSLEEIIAAVYHYMGANASRQLLGARFSSNVISERQPALRLAPLFLKDLVLRLAFISWGDTKSSTTITNIGVVRLPSEMSAYVERMELVLGPLNVNPVCCAVLTYNDVLCFNMVRTIKDPGLEREFFTRLVKLGLSVKIESNYRKDEEACPIV